MKLQAKENSPELPVLSIVIPTLNEREEIEATLDAVATAVGRSGVVCEIVVVDGGSSDGTEKIAESRSDVVVHRARACRASQMNIGADRARAPWLLFLHGDTHLSPDLIRGLVPHLGGSTRTLFAFALRFRGEADYFRTMERGIEWRSTQLGLAYGDQGFCLHRDFFEAMGRFREDAPMEDLDFVLRLRSDGELKVLPFEVHTSTRQYDREGHFWGTARNIGRLLMGVAAHYGGGRGSRDARNESGSGP